jgi:hypothetical protein
VCVEPHRLVIAGKKRPLSESEEGSTTYRVLPLQEGFDPSSMKLKQHGPLIEIELHKPDPVRASAATKSAA